MTSVGYYSLGETIGEGTYGKVKLGTHKLTGRRVAVKRISKQHAPIMAREIHHHRQLRHPNIVTLYEVIVTESSVYVVSEYCPNGELFDALTSCGRCSERRAQKWIRQLTSAIHYCHRQGIVHRDIKLENILLDAQYNVKMCDFGFARQADARQLLETFCGSLAYSAPEVIRRQKYTGPETDVWSLGVIMYTLLAGELPFDDDSEIITQRKIVNVDYEMPSYFSSEAADLIQRMLRLDPTERITVDQIQNHPWMHMVHEDDDDDDDEVVEDESSSACSTRHSSQSDLDSVFSHTIAEDEDEVSELSSFDSYSMTSSPPYSPRFEKSSRFSPQVRYSLGMMRNDEMKRYSATRSPRFSAPTMTSGMRSAAQPHASTVSGAAHRSSLPMLPSYTSRDMDHLADTQATMSAAERRLVVALASAGFDSDALREMRSGNCDSLSGLWNMLVDNVDKDPKQPAKQNYVEMPSSPVSQEQRQTSRNYATNGPISHATQTTIHAVDAAVQTGMEPVSSVTTASALHVSAQSASIPAAETQRQNGWFTSVKSWFGSAKQQQQLQQLQQHPNTPIPPSVLRNARRLSQSHYRNVDANCNRQRYWDVPSEENEDPAPMHRSTSQKHRRRMLQLSNPPVNELEQLSYSATSHKQQHQKNTRKRESWRSSTSSQDMTRMSISPPPTALATPRPVADALSILAPENKHVPVTAARQATEVDVCAKRYSMMYRQKDLISMPPVAASPATVVPGLPTQLQMSPPVHTPRHDQPPSPVLSASSEMSSESSSEDEEDVPKQPTAPLSLIKEQQHQPRSLQSPLPPQQQPLPQHAVSAPLPESPYFARKGMMPSRFEPRSRLSVYGMNNDANTCSTKPIIEEEEEEE
ncbi:hypothetical protein BCR43DRAFT_510049 [Syncephalastrum racemosum]|uniref:Protein kinase domain-containing protein n=1 Tax=Syncephalastrum racemosum TaxID=13706 RepID=A0A1X2HTL7_SYNRA|nr:hypothetical protein BCR43DRAFT_510049 [Syncephalastrum racemosum]